MHSKRVFILFTLVLFVSAAFAQNVLKNPGFEEQEGWNNWGGVQDENPHTGKYSLKITNTDLKWSGSDQIIILPEGVKKITLSGWMKTENVEKGKEAWENARIGIEFTDKDGKQTGGYPQPAAQVLGTTEWRPYKSEYPVPPDAYSVKVQLALGNATGTAWFDDMEALFSGEEGKSLQAGTIKAERAKPEESIRLNQIGFYPNGPKLAVVVAAPSDKFYVIKENKKDTVFTGTLMKKGIWKHSGEDVSHADFTKFTKPGTYYISVPKLANSYLFEIKNNVHHEVGKASLKSYYYQRTVIELKPEHAGKWARKAGHPDNKVLIHPSAASEGRPAGSKISSPYGWYDAGDYNKYIVNSGISTYTLLALYEHFPEHTDTIKTNIPESKNKLPDLVDEALFNVKWMITMQDPFDGGVYHKLTNPGFDGAVMPHEATAPRYVVMKSTGAALDFAAVMAQSYRVFKKFNTQLPGFADSCLTASKKAYIWAKKNPEVYYRQDEMNKKFTPSVNTGEYGDGNLTDEFQWAAMELFASTGEAAYYKDANISATLNSFDIPGWPNVNTLGLITLANLNSKTIKVADAKAIKSRLITMADDLKNHAAVSEFGTPMGLSENNFVWGSNATTANQGIILIQAYVLTKNIEYLNAAIANLDYILGRNGTGFSFVTGYGDKSTQNPHHRPSQADTNNEPVPGLLAGGPNLGMQDKGGCPVPYPSSLPAKAYIDHDCSYAANEIAINWNAPLTYLIFAIEALKK